MCSSIIFIFSGRNLFNVCQSTKHGDLDQTVSSLIQIYRPFGRQLMLEILENLL